MSKIFSPGRPSNPAMAALILSAIAVAIGGFEHARLFHRGYAEVNVVGPLFLLNAIASIVVILALAFDRIAIFLLGALAISVGSIVSILISHSSSFFGFSEGGYDTTASIIVASEAAAVLLALIAIGLGALRREPRVA